MLALAFSAHTGLEVKELNSLLAFGQSKLVQDLVRSIIIFSKWRKICKIEKNLEKRGMSRRYVLTVQLLVSLIIL